MTHEEKVESYRISRELIARAVEQFQKALPAPMFFYEAWQKGIDARERGFARVSPYYEDNLREPYWLAGYDDLEFLPI